MIFRGGEVTQEGVSNNISAHNCTQKDIKYLLGDCEWGNSNESKEEKEAGVLDRC